METKTNYIALTGFRAVAAYMVFLHHNNFKEGVFHLFFKEFHVGVTIFFVLSGFLITYRYYDSEKINYKNYFVNRLARIYPMYFILTTITFLYVFLFHSLNKSEEIRNFLFNITFFKGFFDDLKFTDIAQGWSLTVEELFYFSAPIFFILIKKSKCFLVFLPFLLLATGFLIVHLANNSILYGFMNSNNFMLDFTFFGRCIEFFSGMTLAIFMFKSNFKLKIKFHYFTYLGIFFCAFWIYQLAKINPAGFGTDTYFGKIINTFFLPVFGILPIIYGLIKEKTIVSSVLSSKTAEILGKSSYVFYLIHLGLFNDILNKISTNILFHFIVLNILAILLYSILEKPLNTLIRKRFSN